MISRAGICALIPVLAASTVLAQAVEIPNASFERGKDSPEGWTLSGGKGALMQGAIAVTGNGDDNNYWRSPALDMKPGTIYCLRFSARSIGASGGTPVTGPAFCNRDLGRIPTEWKRYESIFVTPSNLKASSAWLRFGQWHVRGTVAFDDVSLVRAVPVHLRAGPTVLGEGESISNGQYTFRSALGRGSLNHSRVLDGHTCGFNSNRWCLSAGTEVVYHHDVAGCSQSKAAIDVTVGYHSAGELIVEAGRDGEKWRELGRMDKVSSRSFDLPAGCNRVRMRGGDRASLQVHTYAYTSSLSCGAPDMQGRTSYAAVSRGDRRLQVDITGLGDGLPGGDNTVVLTVKNNTDKAVEVQPSATITRAGRQHTFTMEKTRLDPGQNTVSMEYELDGTGDQSLDISLGDFRARVALRVAELHDSSYGLRLTPPNRTPQLWWASSGWKISRIRPAPKKQGAAVRISAARNETEAAQLVMRPRKKITGLTVKAGDIIGPGGAKIPAAYIDVLQVRYVRVTRPTDRTGCTGDWPDPLPPIRKPLDLEARKNQPLWVRVNVPKEAAPGRYKGTIHLKAKGFIAAVPLEVEVFGFALPDRMTCGSAFGFSPGNVFRYQGLKTEEHKRKVLEKYWRNFSDHHISPYHPAPLDPIRVTWSGTSPRFDFSKWDAAMTRAIDEYHFNTFRLRIRGMGGGTFHSRREPSLRGHKEDTPEYKAAFTNYCRAIEAHLKEKGWLDEAFVYWFDEPAPRDYEFVMNGFRKLKTAAPGINRMLTEQVEPALVGGPNIWCPVSFHYDHEKAEQRRKHGERFWWYVCTGPKAPYCTLFIDHPATELRVWLWQTWKRNIDAILVWQTNYWTSSAAYPDRDRPQNPYADPMGWTSGYSTPKGTKRPWGNGDGRFIYPPEAAADAHPDGPVLEGPVDSIRWEMLRDGIEDYEYLAILRGLLEKAPEEQKKSCGRLLKVPGQITREMTDFTRDPAPIERRRREIAKAIETLKAPDKEVMELRGFEPRTFCMPRRRD